MRPIRHFRSRWFAALAAALTVAGLIAAVPVASSAETSTSHAVLPSAIRPAADLSQFHAGNIISDAVFTNSATMTAAQVQSFLQSKVSSCRSGYTCLKDFRQDTPNKGADRYCNGYSGSGGELASTIIVKVAQSCGINPQVLVVMLQKEQGLVTDTWPVGGQYAAAMGQACPDTAPCDPSYAGFFAQVYGGARQMKIYLEGVYFTWYAPGRTWNILYNPNTGCGSSPVYIENAATSALYYYTPYQPNAAALAAGYGIGDSCSAYGNRNFYNYFTDWFGSTQGFAVVGSIYDTWAANGGGSGWIGNPTSAMRGYGGAGWSQTFTNADIYVQAGQPGYIVSGPIRTEYTYVAGVASGLGWPTSNRVPVNGGAYQNFTGGRIYERSDGRAYAIAAPMFALHESVGNIFGAYGWPSSRAYVVTGGAAQNFDGGTFYQSGNSAVALPSTWVGWYNTVGGPNAGYGLPVSGVTAAGSGQTKVLLSKAVAYRTTTSVTVVSAPMFAPYAAQSYESGPLGRPLGAAASLNGGSSQAFEHGTIFASAFGAYAVSALSSALTTAGGVGVVGFPREDAKGSGTTFSQRFDTVTLTTGKGGAQIVRGAIRNAYDGAGGAAGSLGAATGPERAVGNGFVQDFDGGRIICTPSVLAVIPASMTTVWDSLGGPTGRLGWPISAPLTTNGVRQLPFASGMIASGTSGTAYPIIGLTYSTFRIAGGTDVLGAPTAAEAESAAGFQQTFERGAVFVPRIGQASAVANAEYTEYMRVGGPSAMGFAIGPSAPLGSGKMQPFQSGTIGTKNGAAFAVRGTTATTFANNGGYTGPLGYPVGVETKVSTGYVQAFEGGQTYVSPYALAVTRGVLGREYAIRGGPTGALGWPLANETSDGLTWQQRFQNGTIVLYRDGTVVVR
ncbi:conserved exported hypothetical protein [Microbacterium sp. 8M]|uniref:LGFP repeat-containing protein n=1 Tax=Microbacterium sp. 8M TaxID=2653153 RepID=UPI0012F3FAD1|nr:hypothetical protein [Microbacterium sp. 8M]VXB13254.1 conserved exported hypothetical protein [Microbacterium sp. 8M]